MCAALRAAPAPDAYAVFQEARKLEREGETQQAFRKLLALPGGEFAASALARGNANEFLTLLRQTPGAGNTARVQLIEAELLLASGQTDEAKRRFRALAKLAPTENWGMDQPAYYPVEPPRSLGSDDAFQGYALSQPAMPFSYGPGSHRDNWLLRRLIALDLAQEAAAEFARIWEVHRANARPYAVVVPRYDDKFQRVGEEKKLVRPAGFNSYGLQFALEYAFFLKRAGRTNDALAVLLEPLRAMDMDRNPNHTPQEPLPATMADLPLRNAPSFHQFGFGPGTMGVARKEFIRLAQGEFKIVGREPELLAELQKQIEARDNRARRVMAQVRLHQGQRETALALELDFIQQLNADMLTTACRRGMAFEEFQKSAEAVAEFEKALAMKSGPVRLPDTEEQISESPHLQSRAFFPGQSDRTEYAPLAALRLPERLARLYAALGQSEKVLALELAQCETEENRLSSLAVVEQMAQRFAAAGQESRFNQWARERLATAKSPQVRANMAWLLRDHAAAVTNAAVVAAQGGYPGRHEWRERFAKLGRERQHEFLRAVVAANPKDAVARLELLDLDDRVDGPEAITALEALLATDASNAFPRGKGVWNRTHFKNYLDLAYRLMRLYEQHAELDKLRALGLRIAKAEKPFEKYDENLYSSFGENGLLEFGNACLALAIQHADAKPYQEELSAALKNSRWTGARAQLERRAGLAASLARPVRNPGSGATGWQPVLPWANVPTNIEIFASCESVACVARDEAFLYAGMPWGVAVYDLSGTPVTRLALGASVQHLIATQHVVWAGTPAGLYRIQAGQPSSQSQPVPKEDKTSDSTRPPIAGGPNGTRGNSLPLFTVSHHAVGHVTGLGLDGDQLWIGLLQGLQVLNTRALELRPFLKEELKLDHPGWFSRFLPDGEFLWADSDRGLLRYERATDSWTVVPNPGPRETPRLIGLIDGQLWVNVYLDDQLRHRPAQLDRRSLQFNVVQVGGNLSRDQRMVNERFTFRGKDQGRLVFKADWRWFMLDAARHQMRLMPEDFARGTKRISDPVPDGLPLPNGQLAQTDRSGLILTNTGGAQAPKRISAAWPDALRSDLVSAILFEDLPQPRAWLCTGAGLGLSRPGESALENLGADEGVCFGPVLDGVALGGKLYFACGWDDSRGGLIAFDPKTSVFTSFFRSDGLDTDKVVALTAKDGQLEIGYGVEYLRFRNYGEPNYRQFRPARFDPATRRFKSSGDPDMLSQNEAELRSRPTDLGEMPVLGGRVRQRYERDGKTWLCGERGVIVAARLAMPSAQVASLPIKTLPGQSQKLREQAAGVKIPKPLSPEQLSEFLAHTNCYVRANALVAAVEPVLNGRTEYVPAIAGCVKDPYLNARCTAVWMLSRLRGDATVAPLRQALDDSDAYIRAVAALALAGRGARPALRHFEEIIEHGDRFGNFPYGTDSSVGVEASAVRAYAALASQADRDVFALLVQRPPSIHYSEIEQALPQFGESLRRHPDAAETLLSAQDEERLGPRREFVQAVFKHAGKELLPVLHRALASQDRVLRSNAARACGAITDASSIPHLIAALDMESGLARAAIVWALGELKAREALPRLAELYADARNAEHNRRAGAGYMAQQAMASHREEYTALRNLDAIASDWDELKVSVQRRPHDPRRDEELLTTEQVLETVRKIGPEGAQEFYRALAGAKEARDRAEAAIGLAAAQGADLEKSRSVLRNLRGDSSSLVRACSTVSLMQLGEPGLETLLRDRLKSADSGERGEILEQLARLPAVQLRRCEEEINAIAANEREPAFLRARAKSLADSLRGSKPGR